MNQVSIWINCACYAGRNSLKREIQPIAKSADIGDAVIQYLLYESGGPSLIMMHATGFLPWMWHPIARDLADVFTVIAPYYCDYRHAEPEEGGLDWAVLAADLLKLCDTIGVEKPFMVGHSMGATVITLAASRSIKPPRGLILIEPILLPEEFYRQPITVGQHPLASKSIKRRNAWSGRDEARDYLKSRKIFSGWDEEMIDLYLQYGMVTGDGGGLQLACPPRREAALFMGSTRNDPWPRMSGVNCPVLVVEGELSENRTYIDLPKAASVFPGGSYTLIENAGHLVPMEKPREISKLIRNFFTAF